MVIPEQPEFSLLNAQAVLQLYGYVLSHNSMKVQIKENSWIAKMAAAKLKTASVAIVIGNRIHLHNTSREEFLSDTDWVCHELKHVEQYKQNGFLGFIVKYLIDSIKNGYNKNKFEVEARESEKDLELIRGVEFI